MKKTKLIRGLVFLMFIGIIFFSMQSCVTTTNMYKTIPPVTVPDIVQMSKDSVPAKTIISKMRESHTIYRLKASQLSELQKEGVSPEVIDYMQQTYLNAVRYNQQLEDMNYWWPGWDGYYYGGPAFGWPYNYWNYNWGPGIILEGHAHGEGERGGEHHKH